MLTVCVRKCEEEIGLTEAKFRFGLERKSDRARAQRTWDAGVSVGFLLPPVQSSGGV